MKMWLVFVLYLYLAFESIYRFIFQLHYIDTRYSPGFERFAFELFCIIQARPAASLIITFQKFTRISRTM